MRRLGLWSLLITLSAFKLDASNPKMAKVMETKVATWKVGLFTF